MIKGHHLVAFKEMSSTVDQLEQECQRLEAKVNQRSAFKLFNLEERFNINNAKLQREMLSLQKVLHPDKFIRSNKTIQDLSDKLSAIVNQQYQTLKDPYERGKYLLSLESKKSASEIEELLDKVKLEDEFLAEMMDIQEALETHQQDTNKNIFALLDGKLLKVTQELERDFKEMNEESIVRNLGRLKFISKCHKIAKEQADFDTF